MQHTFACSHVTGGPVKGPSGKAAELGTVKKMYQVWKCPYHSLIKRAEYDAEAGLQTVGACSATSQVRQLSRLQA